jgi:ATP-binding cassette subfamily F protein 3
MRHALSLALQDFPGAIVLVSHDRHLLTSTADELWLVRDGAVSAYDGDLSDYARWLRRNQSQGAGMGALPAAARDGVSPLQAQHGGRRRKLSFREQRELDALPGEIERLEGEQARLHRRLADPALYQLEDSAVIAGMTAELERVEKALEHAFSRWGELESAG